MSEDRIVMIINLELYLYFILFASLLADILKSSELRVQMFK